MNAPGDYDRRRVAEARELSTLSTPSAVRERFPGWDDTAATYAEAFTHARYLLADLATLAERLAAVRDLLARFDWEHDDRQYALEAIERIAEGGQA